MYTYTVKFNSAHSSSFTNSYSARHKSEQRQRQWEKKNVLSKSRENLILDPSMTSEQSLESYLRIIYISNDEGCGVAGEWS